MTATDDEIGKGRYGNQGRVGMLADGDHMSDEAFDRGTDPLRSFTDRSTASATILTMPWSGTQQLLATVPGPQPHIDAYLQSREYGPSLAQSILRALEKVEIAAPRS